MTVEVEGHGRMLPPIGYPGGPAQLIVLSYPQSAELQLLTQLTCMSVLCKLSYNYTTPVIQKCCISSTQCTELDVFRTSGIPSLTDLN
jgi:hypothetical protein